MVSDLINLLHRFNRKERFFLVGHALGNKAFRLSEDFRRRLSSATNLGEEIPCDAFAAMDYHLDWVAAALAAFASENTSQTFVNKEGGGKRLVMGSQEDIDLIVCFKGDDDNYRLIFLEAKGYTSWDSRQMSSKVARLKLLFGDDGDSVRQVRPIYCLASPKPPRRLTVSDWPDWLLNTDRSPHFLELRLPTDRLQVTRWDAEKCEASQEGGHFHIQQSGDAKG